MIKAVFLFLIFILILAMFGRLRVPGIGRGGRFGSKPVGKCPHCGRYRIGQDPCPCGKGC